MLCPSQQCGEEPFVQFWKRASWEAFMWKIVRVQRSGINTIKYHTWPRIPVIFDLWSWGQGHTLPCPVVSTTLCDLYICKVWSCYIQWFRRRYNYEKNDRQMLWWTDRRWTDFGTKLIYPIFQRTRPNSALDLRRLRTSVCEQSICKVQIYRNEIRLHLNYTM